MEIISLVEKGERSPVSPRCTRFFEALSALSPKTRQTSKRKRGKAGIPMCNFVRTPAFEHVEKAPSSLWMSEHAIFPSPDQCCISSWRREFHGKWRMATALRGPPRSSSGNISEEREHVEVESMRKWLKDEWPQILTMYGTRDMFSKDETDLFWQMRHLPEKVRFVGRSSTPTVTIARAPNNARPATHCCWPAI
ncbi:hypothetical protein HPB48_007985 [Haemaphysalis longicornis]|uniref:Uncharacterized protein n=1 Tax=Haemaphysalis longicornis TaxID=44386 RepID=A0A9J6GKE7_HAELO|nr:hypothetical protein HPB48_007985 [Haemaphysalis longicornis]